MITRRAFIGSVTGGLLAVPLAAEAQQAQKVWRIGVLFLEDRRGGKAWFGFEQGLRELGYIEGRNLTFESEFAGGRVDQLLVDARSLVRRKVDLIVTYGNSGAKATKEATTTTPIVVLMMFDAVESGLVASLARPGGNITGMSVPASELVTKWLEMLKAAIPHLTRVALLTSGSGSDEAGALRAMTSAARSMGLKTEQYEMQRPHDLDRLFADMKTARMEALAVGSAPVLAYESPRIAALAMIHRIPTVGIRSFVERGGLMYYGPDSGETWRRAATHVDKILKGAKPADLQIGRASCRERV